MDKQEATDHILSRLQAGYGIAEIVDELSHTLKAPSAAIRQFVDLVISEHPQAESPSETPINDGPPDWMETLSTMPQTVPPAQNMGGDLPPGLQALLNENPSNIYVSPAVLQKPTSDQEFQIDPEFPLPRQAAFEPSVGQEADLDIDTDTLAENVFQQLKQQHRHNDIVEKVCNQTGWHWNKSQRFVARVQTKRHDELQSGKIRVIVAIGIGIIFVGLIMALNGASALSDYAKITTYARTNPEMLLNISPYAVVYALGSTITGIGMIIGGGFGIARALSNR